jgi:DNA segregation ATPase FtsK/SpoIIIE, S-DNA-T family
MSDPSLFDTQRTALATLQRLVKERAHAEQSIQAARQSEVDQAEREVQRTRKAVAAARKKAEDELMVERGTFVREQGTRFAQQMADFERQTTDNKRRTEEQHRSAEEALKSEYQEKLWTIDSLLEAGEKEATDQKADAHRLCASATNQAADRWTEAERVLGQVNLTREQVEFTPSKLPPIGTADYQGKLEQCLEHVGTASDALSAVKLPRFTGVVGTMWCVFVAGGLSMAIAFLIMSDPKWAIVIGIVGAVVGGIALRQLLFFVARKQVRDRASALGVYLAETERAAEAFKKQADHRHASRFTELRQIHAADKQKVHDTYRPRIAGVVKQCVTLLAKLDLETTERRRDLRDETARATAKTTEEFDARFTELTTRYDTEQREGEEKYTSRVADADATRDRDWSAATNAWFDGLEQVGTTVRDLTRTADERFPNWESLVANTAPLTTEVPAGIRYGACEVDLFALPDGRPNDPRLVPLEPLRTTLPTFLPFPDRCSVLLKARDAGRTATVAALQGMMLRFLTGLPPGKVRFTIIDPVGLGENFAAFMNLADYDEQLVTSRIWTEPGQIEQRLTDLTEHMENVIQKYLRNQYKSIEEYNRAAGEVAEPYRVLVIANFPEKVTADAAKRLVSIMSSGPACGVCTLLGVDTAAALPRDFRLADIEQVAFNLTWKDGKFTPKDEAFKPFPLTVDAPPSPSDIAAIVRRVGKASTTAARVEVPFDFIAPPVEETWTGSTKRGIEVAIGRAGATRRQLFTLGKGTAQHALVAGKTGSGKSTLLHALITNLALTYSPDEIELYLIDFKKGVEFKMYAALHLPHARVVAIESEREFGLSVLQRLDGILRERGDEYRRAGVNEVAGYRDAKPDVKFPRILLVVDEFQEFFVEDDKLSQEAALLLDRLVRQGRAFGVHVLLGSQTLGGAFSLARTTIDQMAVRIALQCSEADAQLILSKDNSAARLLSRPGEAIYNDSNGTIEGNDPFQVVWLDEHRREQSIVALAARAGANRYPPPLVFEGSAAADLTTNKSLARLIDLPAGSFASATPPTIWLGDSVAIKDPTAAVFRPQSGANLLLIGQSDEAALGIFSAGVISLTARLRPKGVRTVFVIDGTPDDSDFADTLRKVCTAVGHPAFMVERYQLGEAIGELAGEVDRRLKGESADRSPRFLFINGLQRVRDLRKQEDDFGFGRRGEKVATPADHFFNVLRDGPAVGVHTVLWCDSMTNLMRSAERSVLREFTMRVLFPMNANDSSQLIDSPAAARLGTNRALYSEDGVERPEKFRPYGLCDIGWVKRIGQTLATSTTADSGAAPPTPPPMQQEPLGARVG